MRTSTHITFNFEPIDDKLPTTIAYAYSLSESNRKRRDLSVMFNNQDNDFENDSLTYLESIRFKTKPLLDEQVSTKIHVLVELHKNTVLKFNQTKRNCLNVSIGNNVYKLT